MGALRGVIHPGTLRLLFAELRGAGYEWQPQTPDRLLAFRKDPAPFRPLVQWLGLGLPVSEEELLHDGLTPVVFNSLVEQRFARDSADASFRAFYKSEMAVSGSGDLFVVHDHWPPDLATLAGQYVHYGSESDWLARACNRDLEGFIGKRVLDLGCSSGVLGLEVAGVADHVLGIDVSERAIEWGRILARTYGFKNIDFHCAAIGEAAADEAAGAEPWDLAVMNPPMVVPSKDAAYPHRDGGKLGIELPFRFLEFAARHLRVGGELICLATNPIVDGRGAFFERLDRGVWDFVEKRCVHTHFNQSVARKQGYADQGIERIELWFLHLSIQKSAARATVRPRA